jgi:polyisoprenoid-binding protein YceI
MKKILVTFFVAMQVCATFSQDYKPDAAASKVNFVIKNFGIRTKGTFSDVAGTITFNPKNLSGSKFNVSVKANTVNTDNGSRDKHLKKSDYFDVEKFPSISFISTKVTESTIAGRYFVVGDITIKGITKAVQFGFSATATASGYNFKGEFDINRRDFGVGGSSMSLSDNLKVMLDVFTTK